MARTTLVLDDTSRSAPGYRLRLQGWTAELQAGVDLLDRDGLFDAMERE